MPHDPKHLQTVMQMAGPAELNLSFRPMFGGIMGYADGKAFASLSKVGLALKMSGSDHDALCAEAGAKPLQYTPEQPPSKSYVVVPERILTDHETLQSWIQRSVANLKSTTKRPQKK